MSRIACLIAICTACSSVKTPDESPPPATFVSGAGRLTSSHYTFDVELGHGFGQQPLTAAPRKAADSPAVQPSPQAAPPQAVLPQAVRPLGVLPQAVKVQGALPQGSRPTATLPQGVKP